MRLGRCVGVVLLLTGILGAGCGTFNREWNKALKEPVVAAGLEGPWQGRWRSEVNGHSGKLRCLVKPQEDGKYQARFHAKYAGIFSFSYAVVLQTKQVDQDIKFQGEADLGKLAGGIYYYDGMADPTNFFAAYRSRHDHGVFEMQRPAAD